MQTYQLKMIIHTPNIGTIQGGDEGVVYAPLDLLKNNQVFIF